MPKYAVLWDTHGTESVPVGIAIERDGYICVNTPWSRYGIPARFEDPYHVLQADGREIIYRPGDQGYFDQVLVDVSSMLAVGERGVVQASDDRTLLDLLTQKVQEPAQLRRVGTYCVSHTTHQLDRATASLVDLISERLCNTSAYVLFESDAVIEADVAGTRGEVVEDGPSVAA